MQMKILTNLLLYFILSVAVFGWTCLWIKPDSNSNDPASADLTNSPSRESGLPLERFRPENATLKLLICKIN